MRADLRSMAGLALAACLAACADAPAQAIVIIETTFLPEDGMQAIRVGTALPRQHHVFRRVPAQLPLSFGVVPDEGDVSRIAELSVEALSATDEVLVRRSARIPFSTGGLTVVGLCLDRACLGLECAEGLTCRRASPGASPTCEPVDLAPDETCPDL